MEGFKIFADSYRQLVEQGKCKEEEVAAQIKIFDFLGTCNREEICELFNSGVFNEILFAYVSVAIQHTDLQEKEKTDRKIISEMKPLLDTKGSGEILNAYLSD